MLSNGGEGENVSVAAVTKHSGNYLAVAEIHGKLHSILRVNIIKTSWSQVIICTRHHHFISSSTDFGSSRSVFILGIYICKHILVMDDSRIQNRKSRFFSQNRKKIEI